jgi:hypothetical protein
VGEVWKLQAINMVDIELVSKSVEFEISLKGFSGVINK